MPSNLLAIDSNFPTFSKNEPVEVQIQSLVNYLYQLRESLQYSLQNLTKENFNASALENLSGEASKKIAEQLQKISNELNQLSNEVKTIEGRISGVDALSGQVNQNKTDLLRLREDTDALTEVVEAQEICLEEMSQQLDDLSDAMTVDENGTATIGKEEKDLHLVGNVYINGILFTGGEA